MRFVSVYVFVYCTLLILVFLMLFSVHIVFGSVLFCWIQCRCVVLFVQATRNLSLVTLTFLMAVMGCGRCHVIEYSWFLCAQWFAFLYPLSPLVYRYARSVFDCAVSMESGLRVLPPFAILPISRLYVDIGLAIYSSIFALLWQSLSLSRSLEVIEVAMTSSSGCVKRTSTFSGLGFGGRLCVRSWFRVSSLWKRWSLLIGIPRPTSLCVSFGFWVFVFIWDFYFLSCLLVFKCVISDVQFFFDKYWIIVGILISIFLDLLRRGKVYYFDVLSHLLWIGLIVTLSHQHLAVGGICLFPLPRLVDAVWSVRLVEFVYVLCVRMTKRYLCRVCSLGLW